MNMFKSYTPQCLLCFDPREREEVKELLSEASEIKRKNALEYLQYHYDNAIYECNDKRHPENRSRLSYTPSEYRKILETFLGLDESVTTIAKEAMKIKTVRKEYAEYQIEFLKSFKNLEKAKLLLRELQWSHYLIYHKIDTYECHNLEITGTSDLLKLSKFFDSFSKEELSGYISDLYNSKPFLEKIKSYKDRKTIITILRQLDENKRAAIIKKIGNENSEVFDIIDINEFKEYVKGTSSYVMREYQDEALLADYAFDGKVLKNKNIGERILISEHFWRCIHPDLLPAATKLATNDKIVRYATFDQTTSLIGELNDEERSPKEVADSLINDLEQFKGAQLIHRLRWLTRESN